MFQINWDTMTSYKLMKLVITCNLKHKKESYEPRYNYIFFLSGFSFKDTDDSQDSRGREGRIIFYSTLPLPPNHEHWDTYLQLFMWDDYHVSLIVTLEFTRLLLDEIYHLIELPFDWLIDNAIFMFLWWIDSRFLLQQFWNGKPANLNLHRPSPFHYKRTD